MDPFAGVLLFVVADSAEEIRNDVLSAGNVVGDGGCCGSWSWSTVHMVMKRLMNSMEKSFAVVLSEMT